MTRVLAILLVALLAPVGAAAQTAPAQTTPAQTTPAPTTPAPPAQAPAELQVSGQPGTPLKLPATVCDLPIPAPSKLPPAGSPPLVNNILLCFAKQGGAPVIEANTYLFYLEMKNHVSRPQDDRWVPFTEETEQILLRDFKSLWATTFLDDLSIEVLDVDWGNGVIGKLVVYHMEERQRIKIVDYEGLNKVNQSDIEEALKKESVAVRLDSFIDPSVIRRVTGIVRQVYAEKGFQYADVRPEVKEVAGGPKLVHLTFHVNEGPQVKIREIDFVGNEKVGDRKLRGKMKENKGRGLLSFITGGGTYKEHKYEDDADLVVEHYRNKGYISAQVGQPGLRILEDSEDGQKRFVEMTIPVTEGKRYRVGEVTFAGNSVVKGEALRPLFKIDEGEWYNEKKVRKGFEKARELYGSGGYMEFTGYPDLAPRDPGQNPNGQQGGPAAPWAKPTAKDGSPLVDVTMRIQEGKRYFVNRITFVGNTTTRDNVIRREMRLLENGVFDTEALKHSVRRLNQLGYFKPLEGNEAIDVQKTPNADNKVDVKLKFEEQNRNQLTFGAGVSQFEGFFGQLSFQTSNFLGRGETFTVAAQQGSRAKNYELAFSEPFLFDRPMTAGVNLFIREFRYIGLYTQSSVGGNVVYGFSVSNYGRLFVNYSYERVKVDELNPLFTSDPLIQQNNPLLAESLLLGQGGRRTVSKVGPSYVFNTVDHPIFPTSGTRYTASFDFAGLGGNTKFVNPRVEGIWYVRLNTRTSLGFRAQGEYIAPYGNTISLPIFEKLFMGGEYSIRGFDLRTIGPRDPTTGVVIGGNKSLLFNAEYLINIAGPVRLVLFYDAGQVRDRGQRFAWKEDIFERVEPPQLVPFTFDSDAVTSNLSNLPPAQSVFRASTTAFKTSTGAEIRFFMPVLNVPFRLIFAMNPQRFGVLDNQLLPTKRFVFRFAVGTTF
jgi:outer membrane protein insertion porin family